MVSSPLKERGVRIGIPRALLYYHYLPMWKTFFSGLGAEVVVSPPTNEQTLAAGCSRAVGDICLPVKVFCGHALSLAGKCDYLFIPSLHSMQPKVYNCPKFIGAPDIVRATVPECPPVIDPDIDVNRGAGQLYEAIQSVGRFLTDVPAEVERAANKALEAHRAYRLQMESQELLPPQAIQRMFPESDLAEEPSYGNPASNITIAVIGHRYLLYDHHVNHRLLQRLRKMDVNVLLSDRVGKERLLASMSDLVERPYWGYEEEIIGAAAHYLRSDADGLISVSAFGCGPDSVMLELVQRAAKRVGKPFLNLVFDEHTADGGLVTRIEAFVDMARRRRRPPAKHIPLSLRKHEEKEGVGILGIPNLGLVAPAFRASAELLDVRLIAPPVTKRTISLGTRNSPEYACLPFKMILGTFIECLEQGADTLFMVTSSNACRMGYYSKVHEEILRDMGYEFKFLRHSSSAKGLAAILSRVKSFTNDAPWLKVIAAYRLGTAKLKALDDLERKVARIRPVAIDKSEAERLFQEAIRAIDAAKSLSSLKHAARAYFKKLDQLPRDSTVTPLKVGIVGELYVVMEPFVNLNLAAELGKLGIETRRNRTTFFSEYTSFKSYLNVLNSEKQKLADYARPYLRHDVGGHGLETVAEKVRLAREGFDGLVHVVPFTCMPETIAQNTLLRTEEDMPVLTVICDEQLSDTGMLTRLEAFADLLERRRRNRKLQPIMV